jgi:hypothetical protein
MRVIVGIPPRQVTTMLRLEGLAVFVAALAGFELIHANWWLFLLVLAPDLSFFGLALGQTRGVMVYNLAHTYLWPVICIFIGMLTPANWLMPLGFIWATHIGADRALGYGLKYPEMSEATHLGLMGKARKMAKRADAG